MKCSSIILIGCLIFVCLTLHGQGCSDAGFCTMGAMKPDQSFSRKINFRLRSVELSQYRGVTTLSPIVYVANLDLSIGITERTGIQVKVPYQWVSGNLGTASGIGDLSLSLTQKLHSSERFDVNGTLGMKIPTNNSDLKSKGDKRPLSKGLVLPMYYQISLGSVDIVAGASLISKKWLLAVGYQQPLTANNNTFDQEEWLPPVYPSEKYIRSYDTATKLKRGTDIMFRAERNFRFTRYNITLGALPIIRITRDQIVDKLTGQYKKLDKTTGMALSLLAGFGYHLNINNSLKFTYGYKLVDREVNPDGLTRDSVLIIGYLYRF